jgi:LysM repeat protein
VKRGDALSTIATKFDATPDQIRQWNNIEGNLVKIGQRLLVKPAKK